MKKKVRVAQLVEHETEDFGEGVRVTPWTFYNKVSDAQANI